MLTIAWANSSSAADAPYRPSMSLDRHPGHLHEAAFGAVRREPLILDECLDLLTADRADPEGKPRWSRNAPKRLADSA